MLMAEFIEMERKISKGLKMSLEKLIKIYLISDC